MFGLVALAFLIGVWAAVGVGVRQCLRGRRITGYPVKKARSIGARASGATSWV
jgi:hypothetical protein